MVTQLGSRRVGGRGYFGYGVWYCYPGIDEGGTRGAASMGGRGWHRGRVLWPIYDGAIFAIFD